jgi:hypothetical protein
VEKDNQNPENLAAEMSAMDDKGLKAMLENLSREEERVSYRRRIIHGKIDVLRAELVRRLKDKNNRGERLFTRSDIDRLSEILAGETEPADIGNSDDLF